MNELKQLAEFSYQFSLSQLPDSVIQKARYCVLDTIGSALGAVNFDDIPGIVDAVTGFCSCNGERSAAIWGQGKHSDIISAALLNGCMNHALEFDDNHSPSKSHPGGAVIPAIWALSESIGASGREFLEAVIVGYEVMGRIGRSVDVVEMRKHGWHHTGVFGPFGSAAGCGRLLGLNAEQIGYALGMAGTQSAGRWAFLAEGASCKKLNCAKASVNGLISALLAKGGMSGPLSALDNPDGGIYPAMASSWDMGEITRALGEEYEVTRVDKKPYPSCRSTHPAIDAALVLRERDNISPDQIDHIVVDTYEVAVLQCGFSNYPCNAVEAKFSIPFLVASALCSGKLTQEAFSSENMADFRIKRIASCTLVREDPLFTGRYRQPRWGCRMTIVDVDGREHIVQIDDASGSFDTPMTEQQERDKFSSLASAAFGEERVLDLMQKIVEIDTQPRMPNLA